MSNTLLIHIGMPKTGTSALQKFLFLNADKLCKYGWSYPILTNDNENVSPEELLLVENSGNGHDMYTKGILNDNIDEWNKCVNAALKHLNDENVIISSEDISEYKTDKFIAGVKEKYENVKVVIYLRRQDREVESIYKEHIKSAGEYCTFEEFISSYDSYKTWVDYLSKLNSISEIIGKENLIVRIYEKQQLAGNDTATDFLSVLGIPSDKDEWIRSRMINPSLGGNYLTINRLINSVQSVDSLPVSWEVKSDFQDVCLALSTAFNQEKGECGFFTADERKKFLDKFVSENEQIAREYLNRADGILFYDEQMEYPTHEMNQYSNFEADMIRIFTEILYLQNLRLESLVEKKCGELSGKLLMKAVSLNSRGRKLLLFGGGYKCQKLFRVVENLPAVLIADNDLTKQGTVLNDVQVRYAKDIVDWKQYFVIVTCDKTDTIEEQLCSLGLEKEADYILAMEYGL